MSPYTSRLDVSRPGCAALTRQSAPRSSWLLSGLALATVLLGSCQHRAPQAATEPAVAPAGELAPLTMAALFRDRAGMLFALLPEPDSNLVRVDVRYRSGAAADPEGKSGLAHLVEHLTFHLRRSPSEPTLAARLGRDALVFNAYTSWDETHFFATALAPQLDSLIAIETDRLRWGCDELSDDALAHERHVVTRELESKLSTTALWDQLRQTAFASGHSYHRSPGGNPGQISSLSRDDVCRFIDEQYQPSSAIMIVSGKLDVAAAKAILEARYGTLSEAKRIEPRPVEPRPVEPRPQHGGNTQAIRAPVPSPALVALVDSPRWGSPESARHLLALSVLAERLAERVRADDTVITIGQVHLGGWNGGLRGIWVQVAGEDDLDHAARLVRGLSDDPLFGLDDAALAAAKARFQAHLVRAHDSFGARAAAIANALQYAGEPGIDGMLAAVANARGGDIEAAIHQGFGSAHVIRVLPASSEPQTSIERLAIDSLSAALPRDPTAADPDAGDAALPWIPAVDERDADRDLMLPPLPSNPPIESKQLANGLRVVLLPRPGYPMVYARMLFSGGLRAEPSDRQGLSRIATLLRRPGMSAPWSQGFTDVLARIASSPVEIDARVVPEATIFSGSSPSSYAETLLRNMQLHVRYGGYVGLSNMGKVMLRKSLDTIAERQRATVEEIMSAMVGGDASSEWELEAIKTTVSRLQQQDLYDHAARHYRPDNGTLIVAGAFDAQRMMATIDELFADWRPQVAGGIDAGRPTQAHAPSAIGGQHVVLTDASRQHPRVLAIYPGVVAEDKRAAALVLRAILETRLSRVLREVMAATYHVSVRFRGNALVIDTELSSPQAGPSLSRVQAVVAGLRDEQLRTDFILARRKSVEQALAHSMSAAQLIEQATRVHLTGGENDPLDELAADIARLRPSDVAALADERLQASRASWIIVAPREQGTSLFRSIGIHAPRIVE